MNRISKISLSLTLILFSSQLLNAQSKGFQFQYDRLQTSNWNEAVRTANFARPFQAEKMPLLSAGFSLEFFKTDTANSKMERGWTYRLSVFQASFNPGFENQSLVSVQLGLGHRLHVHQSNSGKTQYFLTPRFTLVSLMRAENGELAVVESGDNNRPLLTGGFAFGAEMALSHKLVDLGDHSLSLVTALGYSPVFWTYRPADVINRSLTSNSRNLSDAVNVALGFSLSW